MKLSSSFSDQNRAKLSNSSFGSFSKQLGLKWNLTFSLCSNAKAKYVIIILFEQRYQYCSFPVFFFIHWIISYFLLLVGQFTVVSYLWEWFGKHEEGTRNLARSAHVVWGLDQSIFIGNAVSTLSFFKKVFVRKVNLSWRVCSSYYWRRKPLALRKMRLWFRSQNSEFLKFSEIRRELWGVFRCAIFISFLFNYQLFLQKICSRSMTNNFL